MPRSRMIKPEFWDDEKLCSISLQARLIFIGLWTYSDDYGVVKGNPIWLKSKILPYDGSLNTQEAISEDSVSAHGIVEWLSELEQIRCIVPFKHNNETFYYIRNFLKHQKVNRPSKARNPQPSKQILDGSMNAHGVLMDKTETETETETIPRTNAKVSQLCLNQGSAVKDLDQLESTSNVLNEINSKCELILQLSKKRKKFDPRKWAQQKINGHGHPKAILHCLDGLITYWDTTNDPWGWCNSIFEKQNGNYNESESIEFHEKLKKLPIPDLSKLKVCGVQEQLRP